MRLSTVFAAAALVIAGMGALPHGARAQQTQQAPAASDQQFPVGETVEPQVGQPYVTESIGDWAIRCVKTQDGNDPCHLYQLIKDDQGYPVSEVAIFKLPEGGQAVSGATIITPLGTMLTNMLVLSIDGSAPKRYPFQWCTEVGCFSRLGFTADELKSIKAGNRIAMTFASIQIPGTPITVMVSLKGFTEAYDKIQPQ